MSGTHHTRPLPPQPWVTSAACRGRNIDHWYPTDRGPASYCHARPICEACPVRQACLDWAVETGEPDGMWGGCDPDERAALGRPQRLHLDLDDHQRLDEIRPASRFL